MKAQTMRHYLLEGQHLAPFDEFKHLEPEHHAFLRKGYEDGHFLFSGPQIPAHGGFLVARAASLEELQALLAEEPFVKAGKMTFVRTTQFDPLQHQDFLEAWFGKA
ncbi:YciI family protein [Labrys neptuniae]